MYDVRRLRSCTEEAIYRYRVDSEVDDVVPDCLESIGTVSRPLPDNPLFRIDEPQFVVTGNADAAEFRLRIKRSRETDDEAIKQQVTDAVEAGIERDTP